MKIIEAKDKEIFVNSREVQNKCGIILYRPFIEFVT